MRRNWIKLYVDQTLRGTMMKELPYDERWLWFGILLLTGDSPFDGKICITENIGYTDEQIAELLETPVNVYKSAKEKMIKHDKISVSKKGIITITNWKKYQSEYERQKGYRESSPEWKINSNMGTAIYNSLKGKKDGLSWERLVGYTRKDLVKHLELLFQKGMSWGNYGKNWHIDHNTPKSHFHFKDYNDEEFKKCWALNNLQPMFAHDNLSKGNNLGLQDGVTAQGNALDRDRDRDRDREKENINKREANKLPSLCSESKIPNDIDIKLTQILVDKILENNPKSHIVKSLTEKRQAVWINACRKLREIDGRSHEEIEKVIVWCQEDNFWKANILSMSKLREKFDQLWLKCNETYKASRVGKEPERKETDKQKIFYEKRLKLKESLYKKYKPDFDKVMEHGDQDAIDEIENKIKTQLADFSQNYFGAKNDK